MELGPVLQRKANRRLKGNFLKKTPMRYIIEFTPYCSHQRCWLLSSNYLEDNDDYEACQKAGENQRKACWSDSRKFEFWIGFLWFKRLRGSSKKHLLLLMLAFCYFNACFADYNAKTPGDNNDIRLFAIRVSARSRPAWNKQFRLLCQWFKFRFHQRQW